VVLAIVLLLLRYIIPAVAPDATLFGMPFTFIGMLGGLVCWLLIVVWWLFFSRARWADRLGGVALMIVALVATRFIVHESISTGAMGMLFPILAIPILSLAFVAWAAASRNLPDRPRRAAMAATILLACGVWTLIRTGGFTGDGDNDFAWRWSKTPEERLLAEAGDVPLAVPAAAPVAEERPAAPTAEEPAAVPGEAPAPAAAEAPEEQPVAGAETEAAPAAAPAPAATEKGAHWPGFRGPRRDGIVRGVRIETDWAASPPVELWRRPVGPGWSSFAVHGDLVYTQEQRGEEEIVSCYNLKTGNPVWMHRDAARFWESNAGAGPRATPTLSNGRVYTLGATGILNVLDAASGAVVWSRNPATETGTETPDWGFSASPLVLDDIVVAAVSGKLVAYDLATGEPRWTGPDIKGSYSSPHLATIDGVPQILMLSGAGATSLSPADGKVLWTHEGPSGGHIVQPALTAEGDVLVGTDQGIGRVALARGPGGWTTQERWTSIGLKPYFNDYVVHKGHAYGFDGSYLAAIDLATGKRKWKGGRYGSGQLVLLPDQELLLVLSEKGELALARANPDQFTEIARLPAIEGKTWNHPVLAGDVLLVRNDQEMAAFRLSLDKIGAKGAGMP
jgi:outer membrane protein assembly factor BamB